MELFEAIQILFFGGSFLLALLVYIDQIYKRK